MSEMYVCSDIEEGYAQMVMEQAVQDEQDGAALRRLREALPDGWDWVAESGAIGKRRGYLVSAQDLTDDSVVEEAFGATIAEAADACREALENAVPCRSHDPNSGPGADWCPNCRQYAAGTPSGTRLATSKPPKAASNAQSERETT